MITDSVSKKRVSWFFHRQSRWKKDNNLVIKSGHSSEFDSKKSKRPSPPIYKIINPNKRIKKDRIKSDEIFMFNKFNCNKQKLFDSDFSDSTISLQDPNYCNLSLGTPTKICITRNAIDPTLQINRPAFPVQSSTPSPYPSPYPSDSSSTSSLYFPSLYLFLRFCLCLSALLLFCFFIKWSIYSEPNLKSQMVSILFH